MSKLLGGSLKALGKGALILGKGYALRKEEGARFSSKKEIKEIFDPSNTGVLIDGVGKRLSVKDSLAHVAVIAKSGFGKTTGYIIPNIIDRIRQGDSVVVLDPSRELYERTHRFADKHNYQVLVVDPTDPTLNSFNPFYGLTYADMSDLRSISTSLILSRYGNDKEPIWNDGAISLIFFFAKCLVFRGETVTIPKIYDLLLKFGQNGENLDGWVADTQNPILIGDTSHHDEWEGIISTQDKMLSSFSSTAKTALGSLTEDTVRTVLSGNDIQFLNFRKRRTILYISFPSHKQKDYQFIIDVLYTRLFSDYMSEVPSKQDLTLYCLLDEFGSSYIKDFQLIATNIRKYGVSLSIVMQSIAQLHTRYGHSAEEIKGGLGTYLVFAGADRHTAKEISETIGFKVYIERNNFSDTVRHRDQKNLINPDQIRTLGDDQIVFLTRNKYAFIMDIVPYYKNSKLKRVVS